ncbi:MAG: HU family DNA-binding protein [Candidatus Margulisiibacteriota bacterium]
MSPTKKSINKKILINRVYELVDCRKSMVERVIETFLDEIEAELLKGRNVHLVGFGTFECRHKAGREGRDPMTHLPIQIPESAHVAFKMGHTLKKGIRGEKK